MVMELETLRSVAWFHYQRKQDVGRENRAATSSTPCFLLRPRLRPCIIAQENLCLDELIAHPK